MNIAKELLDSVRDDSNLLQRDITVDEARVYDYDLETKELISLPSFPMYQRNPF